MKSVQFGGVNNAEFPNPLSAHLLFHWTLLITPVMDKVYAGLYCLGIEDFKSQSSVRADGTGGGLSHHILSRCWGLKVYLYPQSTSVFEGLDSQHHSLAALPLEMGVGTHCTIGLVEVL